MFIYEDKLPVKVQVTRPDPHYYQLLDEQLEGCKAGLQQAQVFIQQAFMIHNLEFHDIYMRLASKLLSDMEVLENLIHQMHGEDDRYYDESNDDTPVFEFIPLKQQNKENKTKKHHVNNDLTAAVIRDMEFEHSQIQLYTQLLMFIKDEGA